MQTIEYVAVTCPQCKHGRTVVKNTRVTSSMRIRYHACPACGHRFRSLEPIPDLPK